jgi:hypothetical protein
MLALVACDSGESKASADQPTQTQSEDDESSAPDDKSEKGDDETADKQSAAADNFDDLKSKSCEEFYAYSREVCLNWLNDAQGVSCYKVLMKANSTRKIMAGEGAMAKRAKNLSKEQKVESFCGRPYANLAEKVAKADDRDPVERPPACKETIELIDKHCLKPMVEGNAYKNGCGTALQKVSYWKKGEKYCTVSKNMLMN